ncbi:MAG TPA: hypothetical protein VM640_02830 [Desulfitobacterium sp.]|nr:hypothetical protein [Desulfitobacterium sp.]
MIVGGVLFSRFIPSQKVSAINNVSTSSGPPQFLYELYGGDQEFEKKAYPQENFPTHFKGPLAITTSPEGKIFVADTGHSQIQVFSSKGQWVENFGQGKILTPSGLAYFENKLFIADPNAKKIFVYGEDGKEFPVLLDNQKLPLKDGKQGEVIRPSGIQVGPDHLFYITDIANHRVVILDAQGNIQKSLGSPGTADGQFQYPNALFVSKDGKIYVSDSNNGRLQIFDKEGQFLTKINGSNGKYGSMSLPRGVAVTDQGMIYVVDVFSQTVRVYDEVGIELWVMGGMGSGEGQFNFPNGLDIDNAGHIYVTDRENNRIQVFGYK